MEAFHADRIHQHRPSPASRRTRRDAGGTDDSSPGPRFRILRSALAWGWTEHVVDVHPIRFMRAPTTPPPRRPINDTDLATLPATADLRVLHRLANTSPQASVRALLPLQRAEQDLPAIRLAADSGARRGELTALRFDDLQGRALHISRNVSSGQLTTPSPGRAGTVTLGATTVAMWELMHRRWVERAGHSLGPWVFAAH